MTRAEAAPAAPRQAGREVELSLVITASDPESVLRRLARLRKVDSYVLRSRGAEHIVDRYFDTRDGALRKRGLALRLRTVGGETVIGLKGPRRSASTQTEDRLERERPFSPEAVKEIGKRIGLGRREAEAVAPPNASPDVFLETRLGVRPIQRRTTVRLVRDVFESPEQTGPVLAELVLDRVDFQLDGGGVRHYEIEVEAKRTGLGTRAAKEIAALLLSRYPNELSEWPYGKLPTGMAIEELLRARKLELGPDGALMPPAYEQLRRSLERDTRGRHRRT
jgi:hypothetical protein